MKKRYMTILVLAVAALIWLAPTAIAAGEEKKDRPRHEQRELTEERIERMMKHLAEMDPEKAKELEQLRKEDPEKFKAELRKTMRERWQKGRKGMSREDGRKHKGGPEGERSEHRGRREGEHRGDPDKPMMRRGMPGAPGRGFRGGEGGGYGGGSGFGRRGPGSREMHEEYIKWLEENSPDLAEKLRQMKIVDPERHRRMLMSSFKTHRKIFEASKENPALAKLLKKDMELKDKRNKLLRKLRTATDEEEKKELTQKLEDVLGNRFDIIVKRKQVEYKQLRNKLAQLQKQVNKSEGEVEKWKAPEFKEKNVKAHLDELLSKSSKFKWD